MKRSRVTVLFSLALICLTLFNSCGPKETHSEIQSNFSSYEEASKWYLSSAPLEWMNPDSTMILKVAYHEKDSVMIIFFKSKPFIGYIYGGVPRSIWERFKNASSKGQFYNKTIKGKYHFRLR